MTSGSSYMARTALIVALGGFLMGFDASVISGVVGFIEAEFALSKLELGWSVASLSLAAALAMLASGPLSDRFGRLPVLRAAACLFAVSAVASALAASFTMLVIARIVGGFGVGAALVIAPMYIAEMSPARLRGRMVSLNQLNIVIGISVAFFSNYLILRLGNSGAGWVATLALDSAGWRWMLGVEALPALAYLLFLFAVPESPRWLVMRGRDAEALATLQRVDGPDRAGEEIAAIKASIAGSRQAGETIGTHLAALFSRPMRLVLGIGLIVAVLQQITGINSVFFYAPMIFEQSGIGKDAAFMQAVLVGLTNLVFTVLAILLIDRVGRKPLLLSGVAGIAICMMTLAWGFSTPDAAQAGGEITTNPTLILAGILGFVACFALSVGPVMWVLFSELFPNRVRGIAISLLGLVNSGVSFLVQLLFPWQLENMGNAATFFLYGVFAVIGLALLARLLPETRGKTLEELEAVLVRD